MTQKHVMICKTCNTRRNYDTQENLHDNAEFHRFLGHTVSELNI